MSLFTRIAEGAATTFVVAITASVSIPAMFATGAVADAVEKNRR